ncbi:helix-turn-helix domain-containing protein [Streptomyces prasinus]
MTLPASAGGSPVAAIAQLVRADEDTVRDVIHRSDEMGPARPDPRWAGGRSRLLSIEDPEPPVPPGRPVSAGPGVRGHRRRPAREEISPGR